MKLEDTAIAGAIAGVIAAICGLALGLIFKGIGLTDRTFHDFAQVLILSKLEPGILNFIIGTLAHFGVGSLFGVIFAHFIRATSGKYIIIKGIFFGVTMWLVLIGLGNYFRLPVFINMPPMAALITWVNSAVYGLIMSFTLSKIGKEF